jgi:hypothetical protein
MSRDVGLRAAAAALAVARGLAAIVGAALLYWATPCETPGPGC